MNYKISDWKMEARRVAEAFGIEGRCRFQQTYSDSMELRTSGGDSDLPLREKEGWCLNVSYSSHERLFYLANNSEKKSIWIGLEFDCKGSVVRHSFDCIYGEMMARGLFYLELLTPEVEAALKVSISTHQKLAWMLEHNQETKM